MCVIVCICVCERVCVINVCLVNVFEINNQVGGWVCVEGCASDLLKHSVFSENDSKSIQKRR